MKHPLYHHTSKRSTTKERGTDIQKLERKLDVIFRQVIASALIFLLIYVGGGFIPEQVFHLFSTVNQMISTDDPILTSTEAMGQAVEEGKSWQTAVQAWCVETFLPQDEADFGSVSEYLDSSGSYHANLIPHGPYRPTTHPISAAHETE